MGRVLVVDDEPDVRDVIGRLLKAEGHTVLEAPDGLSALRLITEQHPDIVLLDIKMPSFSGIECLRAIRSDEQIKQTLVIVVSMRGRPSDQDAADELGVYDYILKPWRDGEIEMRVRFALSSIGISHPSSEDVEAAADDPESVTASDPLPADSPPPAAEFDAPQPSIAAADPPADDVPSTEPAQEAGIDAAALSETENGLAAAPLSGSDAAVVVPLEIAEVPDDRPLILVVEDEEYARLPLVDCMQRAGFRTAEETDGAAVAKRVAEDEPDLVLLDLTLPRRDGVQVLRELKGSPETRSVPVIVVTGSASARDIETCLTNGARDYVSKPWHGGDLQHRAGRAIESSLALRRQAERAVERVRARVTSRKKRRRSAA